MTHDLLIPRSLAIRDSWLAQTVAVELAVIMDPVASFATAQGHLDLEFGDDCTFAAKAVV